MKDHIPKRSNFLLFGQILLLIGGKGPPLPHSALRLYPWCLGSIQQHTTSKFIDFDSCLYFKFRFIQPQWRFYNIHSWQLLSKRSAAVLTFSVIFIQVTFYQNAKLNSIYCKFIIYWFARDKAKALSSLHQKFEWLFRDYWKGTSALHIKRYIKINMNNSVLSHIGFIWDEQFYQVDSFGWCNLFHYFFGRR